MADTARPGRTAAPAGKSALTDPAPPLAALPFRLVRGQGRFPGKDYLEYDEEVAVYSETVGGTMRREALEEGRPKEEVAVLSAKKVVKRQPKRLYDYQQGFPQAVKLIEMYRALESRVAGLQKKADELDGVRAAQEREAKRKGQQG